MEEHEATVGTKVRVTRVGNITAVMVPMSYVTNRMLCGAGVTGVITGDRYEVDLYVVALDSADAIGEKRGVYLLSELAIA